jgi:predicted secreted protein
MSVPTEIDFVLVKKGDGGGPETFTQICGIQDATINIQAQSTDRYVRDCAKPGEVPFRKTKVNGKSLDISGSGMTNADTIGDFDDAVGELANYKIELYQEDGTDAGTLLGTYSGEFRLTTNNKNLPRENAASWQINLASNGAWTYTSA